MQEIIPEKQHEHPSRPYNVAANVLESALVDVLGEVLLGLLVYVVYADDSRAKEQEHSESVEGHEAAVDEGERDEDGEGVAIDLKEVGIGNFNGAFVFED